MSKCTRLGSAGIHHESYYTDGECTWCHARPRVLIMVVATVAFLTMLGVLLMKWGLARGISIVAP